MSKTIRCFLLAGISVFLAFAFTTCDLLNGLPNADLLGDIDRQIAWANATPLSAELNFPTAWGTSVRRGDLGDVRDGFSFEVDFEPNAYYALLGWRVYSADQLPANWADSATSPYSRVDDNEGQVRISPLSDVIVSIPSTENRLIENGGRAEITVNTKAPIIVVPWSRRQPRVWSIIPNTNRRYWPRTEEIVLTFTAPLDQSTVIFDPDHFYITRTALDENGARIGSSMPLNVVNVPINTAVSNDVNLRGPFYKNDSNGITVTFIPTAAPAVGIPSSSELTITVGPGVKTDQGDARLWNQPPFEVTWQTRPTECRIVSWEVSYGDDGKIHLNWDIFGGAIPIVRYHLNNGNENKATATTYNDTVLTEFSTSVEITASALNLSSASTSFQNRTLIWIDLDMDDEIVPMDTPIEIWTVPGIKGTMEKPIKIIYNQTNLAAISGTANDADQCYVLNDSSISIAGTWTPLGTSSSQFRGKFFGMGKTITFASGATFSGDYAGLFGNVNGATISDLVISGNITLNGANTSTAKYVGAVIGQSSGSTILKNISVNSNVTLNGTGGSGNRYVGGIIGYDSGGVTLDNVTFTGTVRVNGAGGTVYIGGLIGNSASPTIKNVPSSSYGTSAASTASVVVGDVTSPSSSVYAGSLIGVTVSPTIENLTTINIPLNITNTGGQYTVIGGLFGEISGSVAFANTSAKTIHSNITLNHTVSSVSATNQGIYLGGIVGQYINSGSISNFTYSGTISVPKIGAGYHRIGGIAGNTDSYGANNFSNCTVTGNITVGNESSSLTTSLHIGGIVGRIMTSSGTYNVTNCTTSGNITIGSFDGTSTYVRVPGQISAGGIVGHKNNQNNAIIIFTDTHRTGGALTVYGSGDSSSDNSNRIGGFIGYIGTNTGMGITFTDCSVSGTATVTADKTGASDLRVGGFLGEIPWEGNNVRFTDSNTSAAAVNVTGAGTSITTAGGFAGVIYRSSLLNNSLYNKASSSGKVTAAASTGVLYAGGFAGNMQNGAINSVSVSSAVEATKTGSGDLYAGGLVGAADSSSNITGSYATGTVTAESSSGYLYAGGLVGYTTSTINGTSYATGAVTATMTGSSSFYAGGLAGWSSYITDSYATGKVTVDKGSSSGVTYVGGLVGNARNNITGSHATGDVEVTNGGTGGTYAGGLAGFAYYNTSNSYASGNVVVKKTGTGSGNISAGGLVGLADYPINQNSYARGTLTVTNSGTGEVYAGGLVGDTTSSISDANASGSVSVVNKGTGYVYAGGLAGYSRSNITRSYAYASSGVIDIEQEGNNASIFAGGLVGYMARNDTATSDPLISFSWAGNKINVSRTGSATSSYATNAGGLAGYIRASDISHSYALGDVIVTDNTSAAKTVGGLVGYTYDLDTSGGWRECDINFTFARGTVDVTASAGTLRAGGLVGYLYYATLYNSVALGDVFGPGSSISSNVNRIVGDRSSLTNYGSNTLSNNRARANILVGSKPGSIPASNTDKTHDRVHGESVIVTDWRTQAKWANSTSGNMGFGTANWSYTTIGTDGFPILTGVGESAQNQARSGKTLVLVTKNITKQIVPTLTTPHPYPGEKGSFTVVSSAEAGATVEITAITANTGYERSAVVVFETGNESNVVASFGNGTSYSFNMPDYDVTVRATFTAVGQTITKTAPQNGSFFVGTNAGADSATAPTDSVVTISNITANSGYNIGTVSVTAKTPGVTVDITTAGTYTRTFVMPAGGVDVSVAFDAQPMTISGVISSGKGSITVNNGTPLTSISTSGATGPLGQVSTGAANVPVVFAPADGYSLGTVSAYRTDDEAIIVTLGGSGNNRTMTVPGYNVTITAVFNPVSQTITKTPPQNGSFYVGITSGADSANAPMDSTVIISGITANEGYSIGTVTVTPKLGGTVVVSGSGDSRTFTMPYGGVDVSVTFNPIPYNVNINAGTGGAISRDPATATIGTTVNFTVTPAATPGAGYIIQANSVSVTGQPTVSFNYSTGLGSFTMPASNVTINAAFDPVHTINVGTVTLPAGGSLAVSPSQATNGTTITITATANNGYTPITPTVSGTGASGVTANPSNPLAGNVYSYTFTVSNTAPTTYTVNGGFTANSYSITKNKSGDGNYDVYTTASGGAGGGVTVSEGQYGTTYYIRTVPTGNATVLSVTFNGTSITADSANVYSFQMPATTVTVMVTFSEDTSGDTGGGDPSPAAPGGTSALLPLSASRSAITFSSTSAPASGSQSAGSQSSGAQIAGAQTAGGYLYTQSYSIPGNIQSTSDWLNVNNVTARNEPAVSTVAAAAAPSVSSAVASQAESTPSATTSDAAVQAAPSVIEEESEIISNLSLIRLHSASFGDPILTEQNDDAVTEHEAEASAEAVAEAVAEAAEETAAFMENNVQAAADSTASVVFVMILASLLVLAGVALGIKNRKEVTR